MESVQIYNAEYDSGNAVEAAYGQYIWINGKKYIDLAMGGGTHLFGHVPSFMLNAVGQYLPYGTHYAYPSTIAEQYAERFNELTGYQGMVFCSSGTEANIRAARIARAYTCRKKVAILPGSWHGSSDLSLWLDYPSGVDISSNVVILDSKTDYSKLAMVLVEPHQGSHPMMKTAELQVIRDKCTKDGVLLCFDEVLTGIRVGRKYCHVKPDISTYGKIFGGGFPIGIVASSKKIMQVTSDCFMGGTFSGNPISLVAGLSVLAKVDEGTVKKVECLSNYLKWGVNRACERVTVMGVGSLLRLIFTRRQCATEEERLAHEPSSEDIIEFVKALRDKSVHINYNCLICLSTKHTTKDLDSVIATIKKVEAKCLPKNNV